MTINPRIVEALYCEALALSDEVRAAFTLPGQFERAATDEDLARVALSSEGLRTTTRMMHAIAWLLNHRAYFMGEISELQLHRHGRLSQEMSRCNPQQVARLDPHVAALVDASRSFYERLLRLDRGWRLGHAGPSSPLDRLRQRIEERMAG